MKRGKKGRYRSIASSSGSDTLSPDRENVAPTGKRSKLQESEPVPNQGNDTMSDNTEFEGWNHEVENPIITITPNQEDSSRFFANSIKTYRLLQNSPIGRSKILENKGIPRKNIQVVKIEKSEFLNEIMKIEKLGDFKVKCKLGKSDAPAHNRIGVMGPIGKDTDLNDLKEIICEEGHNVTRIGRLVRGKRNNYEPTDLIKVWFEVDTLPEYLLVMAQKFNVRPFIQRAFQCFNCQSFGHLASNCTASTKCVLCAGNHRLTDCPNKTDSSKKCANCGESHTANYSKCPFMIKENKVQKIKANEGLTYRDAVKKLTNNTDQHKNLNTHRPNQMNDATHAPPGTTYAYVSQSSETNTTKKSCDSPILGTKFVAFIFEIIREVNCNKSVSQKCATIQKVFKSFYKSDLDLEELENTIRINDQ